MKLKYLETYFCNIYSMTQDNEEFKAIYVGKRTSRKLQKPYVLLYRNPNTLLPEFCYFGSDSKLENKKLKIDRQWRRIQPIKGLIYQKEAEKILSKKEL